MIRNAEKQDATVLMQLLRQLDYPIEADIFTEKFSKMLKHPDEQLLVYLDENEKLCGFISIHFIPQIALAGDFARISYFVVDKDSRGKKIGNALEKACVKLAVERGCDRIEVHCHERRKDAHRFYFREGYEESPKYLIKKI